MLVFLIHGVATQNAGYGDRFKKKVKELILEAKANHNPVAEETSQKNNEADNIPIPVFYSSFWGHTFKNQTDQLFNWVRSDIQDVTQRRKELKNQGKDIYRYQELREDFIGKLGVVPLRPLFSIQ
jgi:hypothetical protein